MPDTPPPAQLVDGVYFIPSTQVSGTGIYTPVLAIGSNTGTETGYNGSTDTGLDTNNPKTNALPIGQLQLVHVDAGSVVSGAVSVAAGDYYVFRLDLNEPTTQSGITFTSFRLFSGPDATAGLDFANGTPSGFSLDFSLGHNVDLVAWANGSGTDDYAIYIPAADVQGAGDLTVYMSFTDAQGGFEELKAITTTAPPSPPPPPVAPAPALDVSVQIWDGAHFVAYDGSSPNELEASGAPKFQYTVANTGNEALTVTVNDSAFGAPGSTFTLAAGATATFQTSEPWSPGSHTDAFTANWTDGTASGSGSAAAAYTGVAPHLVLDSVQVSYDGGAHFQAYDPSTTPADLAANGAPVFAYSVHNDGNVDLKGVGITDSFGANAGSVDVAAGGTAVVQTTEAWAAGLHTDSFDAHWSYTDDSHTTVTGDVTASAAYTGAAPHLVLDSVKVSYDGGTTFQAYDPSTTPADLAAHGAPVFAYTVRNDGNVDLTGVSISDSFGTDKSSVDVAAGGTAVIQTTEAWVAGLHTDSFDAHWSYSDGHDSVSGDVTGSAAYTGAAPDLVLDSVQVSYDGGATFQAYDPATTPKDLAAHGAPVFAYTLRNDGNVDLTGVSISDSFGTDKATVDVAAGGTAVIKTTEAWGLGAHTDSFDAHWTYSDGHDSVSGDATSGAAYQGVAPGVAVDLQVSKDGGATWLDVGNGNTADNTFLNTGASVQFRVVVTNTGNDAEAVSAASSLDGGAAQAFTFGGAGSTTLAAGASVTSDVLSLTALHGLHTDVATASASMSDGHDSQTVSATDTSNYDGFSEGRAGLSIGYWSNHASAAVWNNVGGQDGVLLGAGSGGATLFIPKAAALLLLSSSTSANDARQLLLSQAIGAQLNINAGATAPAGLMGDAVGWLTSGGGNVDGVTHNGVLDSSEYAISTVKGSQVITLLGTPLASSGAAWSKTYLSFTTDHGTVTADGEGLKNALMAFDQNQLVADPLGGVAYNASGAVGGTTSLWSVNGAHDYLSVLQQSHLFDGHGII